MSQATNSKSQNPSVTPFSARLPQISSYPMQGGALSMIALLSVLRLIDLLPMGILVMIGHFLISMSLFRYSIQVFYDTSEGKLTPPEYSFEVGNTEAVDQIKLQALLTLAMLAAFFFGGIGIGIAVMLIIGVATPAATMSLAMERSLLHALNPLNWMRIATGLGASYLLLAAFCIFYGVLQTIAVAFLPDWLPRLITIPVVWFLSHYTILVSFHAMGYVIYQNREKIGLKPIQHVPLPERRHQLDPDQDLVDELNAMAARGQSRDAIARMRQHLDSRGGTQKSHDLYRQLLSNEKDQPELTRHARQYVSVLMAQGAGAKALQMLQTCLQDDADYAPSDAEELRPLAENASKFGKHDVAVRILVNGMKRFAKFKGTPSNALFAARLLSEKLGNDAKAQQLLGAIKERFPEHPETSEIDRYLAQLATLQR